MAQKGILLKPKIPIQIALERAIEMIEAKDCEVALFFVGGKIISCKSTSESYEGNCERLASGMIGVYTLGVDYRNLRADIAEFYK